jgi:hypothetical protein
MLIIAEAGLLICNAMASDKVWLGGEILIFAEIAGIFLMVASIETALKERFGA